MNTLKTHEILNKAFRELPHTFVPGFLEVRTEAVSTAEEALRRISEFGGEGWIQLAEQKEILTFEDNSPLGTNEGWPVQAEAVRGDISISLTKDPDGWILAFIEKHPPRDDTDLLAAAEFRRRDGGGTLCYETYWTKKDVFGQWEIRPEAFRFSGFSKRGKEDRS